MSQNQNDCEVSLYEFPKEKAQDEVITEQSDVHCLMR